jgi:hypothetical protein
VADAMKFLDELGFSICCTATELQMALPLHRVFITLKVLGSLAAKALLHLDDKVRKAALD